MKSLNEDHCCRFCQVTKKQDPRQRFIAPCSCIGSMKFVHLSCLAKWRSTSDEAFKKCNICNRSYNIENSLFYNLLENGYFIYLVTTLVIFLVSIVLGYILVALYAFVATISFKNNLANVFLIGFSAIYTSTSVFSYGAEYNMFMKLAMFIGFYHVFLSLTLFAIEQNSLFPLIHVTCTTPFLISTYRNKVKMRFLDLLSLLWFETFLFWK